jgi:hypothetical protein
VGWVDAKIGDPVDDKDICGRYEKEIMSHAGARFFGELLLVLALSCLMPSIRVRITTLKIMFSTRRLSLSMTWKRLPVDAFRSYFVN